jgi:phosphohistidine phosphatase
MLTLMLLRHAKAEPGAPRLADKDRALAERGIADATRMGARLVREGMVPDRVICSSARRTRETWALVSAELAGAMPVDFEPAIYEATTARLLAVIRRAPSTAKRLLLIGHNPGFEDLTNDFVRDAETGAAARLAEKYPTCGLAVLELPITAWSQATPRSARLTHFTAPRYWG